MPDRAPRLRLLIDPTGATIAELEGIGFRARNAKPVMARILKHMTVTQREQFLSEGARGDRKWDPDKDNWIERKRAKGWHTETEQRLGDLMTSLTVGSGGEFANEVRHVGKTSATFGTTLFYARFQGHRRRLLYLTGADVNYYAELVVDYILSGNA